MKKQKRSKLVGRILVVFSCCLLAQVWMPLPSSAQVTENKVQVANAASQEKTMSITEQSFGSTADGKAVTAYRCENRNGLNFTMIDYGATMISLETRDNQGQLANIILTCDSIDGFEKCQSYFGCTVGRYCNRIAAGKFSIDGQEFTLATNNGENHLHGGVAGFDKQMWSVEKQEKQDGVGLVFSLTSPDGDEGYPGKLDVSVEYFLDNNDDLHITYEATSDASTVCNLTNHNYWNLRGAGNGDILKHSVTLYADQFIGVDGLIPTGEYSPVAGTALDFRQAKMIGTDIDQLRDSAAKGYDHCFVVRGYAGQGQMRHAADVLEPDSGRVMQIYTDQPGIQFYTGNFLDGGEGSGGYPENAAFCLETQKHPDTPNQPNFPTALLKPGETYRHRSIHKFRTAR